MFVSAYIDLLYKHMGNNMVLGIMNINLTYDPNSKKSVESFQSIQIYFTNTNIKQNLVIVNIVNMAYRNLLASC